MLSELDLTLGAVEIGCLLSSMLYGAVTVQLYTYSGKCKGDPLWLIVMVVTVWILETIFTILSILWLYNTSITGFGNPVTIAAAPWSLDTCVILQGLVGAIVQSFFAFRVWKISKKLLWPVIAWIGAAIRIAFNCSISSGAFRTDNIVLAEAQEGWQVTVSLSVAVVVDILIVTTLSYHLTRQRLGVRNTSRVVDKVIIYSVETGFITSITAICVLVTRTTMPNNYVWLAVFQLYAKLYSNSLMLSLNVRSELKKDLNDIRIIPTTLDTTTSSTTPSEWSREVSTFE